MNRLLMCFNRPFYRYGGHIEFIRFKEYYGMPRGHSLGIYPRFSGKKRASIYISWEKGDHYYIQTWHDNLFFRLQSFSRKTLKKLAQKARVNTDASILDHPHVPMGIPEYSLNPVNSIRLPYW